MQPIEHIHLEQLLVADPHLDRVVGRTVLVEPVVDQGHVNRPPCAARPAEQVKIILGDDGDVKRAGRVPWSVTDTLLCLAQPCKTS